MAAETSLSASVSTTDTAGNTSSASDGESYSVDTTAPVISINVISGDDIINGTEDDSPVTISGTSGGAEVGQTVTVSLSGKTYTTTVQSGGVWTLDVPAVDIQALDPAETVTASVSDLAGNAATPATRPLVYDATAPAAPTVSIEEDANDDGFINDSELSGEVDVKVTLPGGLNPGDTLTVTDGTTTRTFTLTPAEISAGEVATSFTAPPEGSTLTVSAFLTDVAGNTGASDSDSATIDTSISAAITLDNDITSDDVINLAESSGPIAISGSVGGDVADGATVTLTVGSKTFTGSVSSGRFSISVPGADLIGETSVSASVSATDTAGNTATATDSEGYSVDITPPSATITLDANITADDVINAAEAGSSVSISGSVGGDVADGDTVTISVGSSTYTGLVSSGRFSISVPGADLAAETSLSASVSTTDTAGNTSSASDSESYSVDTTAPVISINVISGDDIINGTEDDSPVTISGTSGGAEVGQTVTVSLSGKTYTTTVQSGGAWTLDVPAVDIQALDPAETVTASVSDLAGNAATPATRPLVYDATAPSAPTVSIEEDSNDDGFINDSELSGEVDVKVTLPGGLNPGDTLTVTDGTTTRTFTLTPAEISAGEVATSFTAPPEGSTLTVSAFLTDVAGNTGASDSDSATIDTSISAAITLDNDITSDDVINLAESSGPGRDLWQRERRRGRWGHGDSDRRKQDVHRIGNLRPLQHLRARSRLDRRDLCQCKRLGNGHRWQHGHGNRQRRL